MILQLNDEWRIEAAEIVKRLEADDRYSTVGISQSDAQAAFAFLRRFAKPYSTSPLTKRGTLEDEE